MKYLRELFSRILSGETPESILKGLDDALRGHVGEAILRLLTMMRIHHNDRYSTVIPCKMNPTTNRVENFTSSEIIDLLKSGLINSGGSNKVDVAWREGEILALCSSKMGKIENLDQLQILQMLGQITEGDGYTDNGIKVERSSVKPYQLVSERQKIEKVAEASRPSNKASKDCLNLLDVKDLNRMCEELVSRIRDCPARDLESIVSHIFSDPKPVLQTRFHQNLICSKAVKLIDAGQKTILIGALPRSGKTWMGASLAIAKRYPRILVITTRPTETKNPWLKVFKIHREFSSYQIESLDSKAKSLQIAEMNRSGKKMIAVASIQFLKVEQESRHSLIGLDWDLVIIDEVHEGGSTELSTQILQTYLKEDAIRILMTATYTKPVECYNIPTECCLFWDLEDVRLMRNFGQESYLRLSEKYGEEDVKNSLPQTFRTSQTEESIRSSYSSLPQLGIMTTMMQQEVYSKLRAQLSSPDNIYGFSMRSLFLTSEDGLSFQNQRAVDTFLALISGSNKYEDYPRGDMSILSRILRYWKKVKHRNGDEFMTSIWFLQYGVGQYLKDVKFCLEKRIEQNPLLRQFKIITLEAGTSDISNKVTNAVIDAKAQGLRGLIILTGNVGSLGVSLPEVDVAFMLHDRESSDLNYQQMMRVLTEDEGKRYGIVVDFNLWRTLTTLNTYATSRCGQTEKSSAERIRWYISHLISIDPDIIECRDSPLHLPQEKIAEELTSQWRRMLEYSGTSLKSLARKQFEFDDSEDQRELEKVAKYLDSFSFKESLELNPEQDKLPKGVEAREPSEPSENGEQNEKDEELLKKVNFNDLLSRLIPETAILSNCTPDLLEALSKIHKDPKCREAVNEFLIQLYG